MKFKKNGFSLMEVLLAAMITAVALVGLLATYLTSFDLLETAKNTTHALNAAQKTIEEIRGHTFSDVYNYYVGSPTAPLPYFSVDGIPAGSSNGLIEIDNSNPELLVVTVTVCWRQKNGRVVGGDAALNPLASSPVRLITYVANR